MLIIREDEHGVKLWVKKDPQFAVEFVFEKDLIHFEFNRLFSKVGYDMFIAEGLAEHSDDTVQLLYRVCKSKCTYHSKKPLTENECEVITKKYPLAKADDPVAKVQDFDYLVVFPVSSV